MLKGPVCSIDEGQVWIPVDVGCLIVQEMFPKGKTAVKTCHGLKWIAMHHVMSPCPLWTASHHGDPREL